MSPRSFATTIRAKKLGVLIRDARLAHKKSLEECARLVGVSDAVFEAYELGEKAPSLPELELLAFHLGMSLDHFWGSKVVSDDERTVRQLNAKQLTTLRQRMIGVILRQTRLSAGLSLDDVAAKVGFSAAQLENYELGHTAVPLPELEALAGVLKTSLRNFQDRNGPVGSWFVQQRAVKDFMELNPELQAFVSKPVNRPYLELALRLSEMQVDKLRAVAEGLLEITL